MGKGVQCDRIPFGCILMAFFQLLRTCVQLGIHYWVVTNYNEFIFGCFSECEWQAD